MLYHRVNIEEMPMSFQEYCSWYFNSDILLDIFGLPRALVLPEVDTIIIYALQVEGYEHDDLYTLLAEPDDKELFEAVTKKLQMDCSFPNLRQTAKTICRWIVSQEALITKNLEPSQRNERISNWEDYSFFDSPFRLLTTVFTFAGLQEDDLDQINEEVKPYFFYFQGFFPDFKAKGASIAQQFNIPKEYDEIFEILLNYYAENYSINDWIAAEARIVDLARTVEKQLEPIC